MCTSLDTKTVDSRTTKQPNTRNKSTNDKLTPAVRLGLVKAPIAIDVNPSPHLKL